MVKQGCVAAFARLQIDGCIVRGALLPTPREEAEPCERSRPDGGLVRLALVTVLLRGGLGPEGVADRFGGPLHNRLSQGRGHWRGQCTQDVFPLRSVTGAMPAYFWRASAEA